MNRDFWIRGEERLGVEYFSDVLSHSTDHLVHLNSRSAMKKNKIHRALFASYSKSSRWLTKVMSGIGFNPYYYLILLT
jgi:hypothetical protein